MQRRGGIAAAGAVVFVAVLGAQQPAQTPPERQPAVRGQMPDLGRPTQETDQVPLFNFDFFSKVPFDEDAANWRLTGITPVTEDITLYAMSPHMHLRGKSLRWVVTYPDGRDVTILDVPKFDFNWQINYELAEPLRIPAGSKISGIGVYDNSLANRWNPAPHLEVFWSEQSWDEMYQPFTEYSVDSQDLTKGDTLRRPPTGQQP